MPPEPAAPHGLRQAPDAGVETPPQRVESAGAAVRGPAVRRVLPAEQEARRGACPAEPEEAAAGGAGHRGQPSRTGGGLEEQQEIRRPGTVG